MPYAYALCPMLMPYALEKRYSPSCVIIPNFVALGQTIGASDSALMLTLCALQMLVLLL